MTGQVRSDIIADYAVQRTYGPQEANTLAMASPVRSVTIVWKLTSASSLPCDISG